MQMRTPRMRLRPLAAGDRAEFVRVHELSRELFEPWSPRSDPEQTFDRLFEAQLERAERGLRDGTHCPLAGFLEDGRIAGFFSLSEIVRGVFQNAYAGWRVSAEVLRQGFAFEGVTALLDLAFAPAPAGLGLHRVQANVIPANRPSIGLAEKVGFRREGLAKAYLKIAGLWQDHVMYAKLAEEHRPVFLAGAGAR